MHLLTPAAEVIAHRGASAYAIENTLAAYDLALAQGADALELDVRMIADGQLVLVHDETLLRTAGDPRRVDGLTSGTLDELDGPGLPPALDAVFTRYGRSTRYFVDLKDPTPAWERRVPALIERHGLQDLAVVQSFEIEALRRLRRRVPWLRVVALYRRRNPPAAHVAAVSSFATGIGPWHGHVDAQLVADVHARGLAVRPWTVDEPAEIERLLALGVDGIITNAPDVAGAVVRRAAALPAAA